MTLSIQAFRIALVLVVISVLLAGLSHPAAAEVPARDGFVGVITKSESNKPGSQIVFANLRSPRPFVTWPSGNGSETNKAYEDEEFVVLFFVASVTGGTETFYLNKKTRRFTLVEVTMMGSSYPGSEIRPIVTYGTLK